MGQNSIQVDYEDDDIQYKGIFIPLEYVRKEIKKKFPDFIKEYRLNGSKKFNSCTGEIIWKYAWDNIIATLWKSNRLDVILRQLIKNIKE